MDQVKNRLTLIDPETSEPWAYAQLTALDVSNLDHVEIRHLDDTWSVWDETNAEWLPTEVLIDRI